MEIEGRVAAQKYWEAVRRQEEAEKHKLWKEKQRKENEEKERLEKEARETERAIKRERARLAQAKDEERNSKGKWPRMTQ